MSDYIPVTDRERADMLASIGVSNVSELFKDVPEKLKVKSLGLPGGLSQQEVAEKLAGIASRSGRVPPLYSERGEGDGFAFGIRHGVYPVSGRDVARNITRHVRISDLYRASHRYGRV